jgi:hypothetical protein
MTQREDLQEKEGLRFCKMRKRDEKEEPREREGNRESCHRERERGFKKIIREKGKRK